jgi:hypothetical protein
LYGVSSPEQAKAGMMPGKHRFWLDDGQRQSLKVRDSRPEVKFREKEFASLRNRTT